MRAVVFTVAVTCASRGMVLRDRMLGIPGETLRVPGVTAVRAQIPSGGNALDAVMMQPADRPPAAGLLICHGIGETVEHWWAAQGLLAERGVASLVFNYSGCGRSSGWVDAGQWERDAVEAFRFLEGALHGARPTLLGYSIGSGVATAVAGKVGAAGLVLCSAFTSLRQGARRFGVPGWAARMLPDVWDNAAALREGRWPVLMVHGGADRLFPPCEAKELLEAAGRTGKLVVVPGVAHNGAIFEPRGANQMLFWEAVIAGVTCSVEGRAKRALGGGGAGFMG